MSNQGNTDLQGRPDLPSTASATSLQSALYFLSRGGNGPLQTRSTGNLQAALVEAASTSLSFTRDVSNRDAPISGQSLIETCPGSTRGTMSMLTQRFEALFLKRKASNPCAAAQLDDVPLAQPASESTVQLHIRLWTTTIK